MKMDRKKNAIRNIIWGNVSKISNIILPFLVRTVIIQKLGVEYLGLNSLFTSILQVLSLSELGISSAIVYSMYAPIARNETAKVNALLALFKNVYRVIGIIILISGTVLIPFVPILISGSYPTDINIYFTYFLFLINTVISYFFFGYRSSILSAFQREDLINKTATAVGILKNVLQIICIFLTHNYYFFIIVIIVSTLVTNIITYILTRKYFSQVYCEGNVSKLEKKNIKKNVIALACHKVGGTILNSADSIVISSFLGLAVLAKYNNYYYIITSIESIVIVCFSGLTAGIGNSFILENKKKNASDFFKVLFLNVLIVLIMASIFYSSCQSFIIVWLGEKFVLSTGILLLMVFYFFVHSIRRTAIVYRDATGMWWDNKFQPLVSSVFNLIINLILVNFIGLYGIIISSILSMIVIDIPWESRYLCKNTLEIKEYKYYFKLIKGFISLLFAIVLDSILMNFFHFDKYVDLVMNTLIGLFGAIISIIVFWIRDEEVKYYIGIMSKGGK